MSRTMFYASQRCFFSTDSPLYTGTYEVQIRAVHTDRMDLNLCYDQGRLALPPVGTKINWLDSRLHSTGLTSMIIHRDLSEQTWTVTLPQQPAQSSGKTRVLAVGSGTDGVGKTTFSFNLALALARYQQRVILLDAEKSLANIEFLLELPEAHNLSHVINGKCTLTDVLVDVPGGISLLPGAGEISALLELDSIQFSRITSGFAQLDNIYDYLIVDTGAGISERVLQFLGAADRILLVTTPKSHDMLDAYSLIKTLVTHRCQIQLNIVINRAETEPEANQCMHTLNSALHQFLNIKPVFLGWLPYDRLIPQTAKDQLLFLSRPNAGYSQNMQTIASKVMGTDNNLRYYGMESFFNRLREGLG